MGIDLIKHIFNCSVFQRAQVEGRLKEQQIAILSLREDLKKPMYRNAEKEYLEKVIKKKVG
jgi:hypothetical protein